MEVVQPRILHHSKPIMNRSLSSFISTALSAFEIHGILVTKKKTTVLYAVEAAGPVFDADSVYITMRNAGLSVCPGTVLKVISLLLRFNLITPISSGLKPRRFLRTEDKQLSTLYEQEGISTY